MHSTPTNEPTRYRNADQSPSTMRFIPWGRPLFPTCRVVVAGNRCRPTFFRKRTRYWRASLPAWTHFGATKPHHNTNKCEKHIYTEASGVSHPVGGGDVKTEISILSIAGQGQAGTACSLHREQSLRICGYFLRSTQQTQRALSSSTKRWGDAIRGGFIN